jgi:3-oxoacyl-[acyl-carrier-protein] synthase I
MRTPFTSSPIVLVAMGASTCLGRCVQAASAARSQITRFSSLGDTSVMDEETGEVVGLLGAPAAVASGFEGDGRVIRLAVDAMDDLYASADGPIGWARTALFLALTPPELEAATELDDADTAEVEFEQAPSSVDAWGTALAERIAELSNLRDRSARPQLYLQERHGTVLALRDAVRTLTDGTHDQVIVLAADSTIDDTRLGRWAAHRRLRIPSRPVGILPGEAAVACLFARLHPRAGRVVTRSSCVHFPVIAANPTDGGSESVLGRRMSQLLSSARAMTRIEPTVIYADLNGEVARASEFGSALAQLPPDSSLRSCFHFFPALAFGETGAAGPLLGLVLTARAFERGYASGQSAIGIVASDEGLRAAIVVERAS